MDDNLKQFKTCPFCEKTISVDAEYCPYCLHQLMEKFPNGTQLNKDSIRSDTKDTESRAKTEESEVHYKYNTKPYSSYGNNPSIKRYIFLALIIIGIIWLVSIDQSSQNKTYISLPNGTIFYSAINYLSGQGRLDIDNGINYDSVVKLINVASNKLVKSVYIQANSKYSINGIIDGNYRLLFMHGKNWDGKKSTFLVDKSYYQFDDVLNFQTITKYDGIETTIYELTLYPVPQGTAKTSTIPQDEFDKY